MKTEHSRKILDADRQALLELLEDDAFGDEEHVHPLSDAQQRLWFADRVEGSNVLFNFPAGLSFGAHVDLQIFQQAFQIVARRHLVLTAYVQERDGRPVQVFDPNFVVQIPVVDLSALPDGVLQSVRDGLLADEAQRVFDLAAGPLFHILQLRLMGNASYLLLNMHHFVSDGWSGAIFIGELLECFDAASKGRAPRLKPLDIQYSDFAYWQQERLASAEIADSLAWWKQQLTHLPTLRLPLDRPRSARRSTCGASVSQSLPPALVERLRAIGQAHGCTLFATLLGGFMLLLSRYHGGQDVVVGTSVASRPRPELESLIGLFVNQLVLRTQLNGNPSFLELVQRASATSIDALSHQEVPFDRVVATVAQQREVGVSPLFQVLFLLNNMPKQQFSGGGGLQVQTLPIASRAARFDLSLTIEEHEGGLVADFGYRTDIFDPSTIATMAARYLAILHRASDDPSRPIDEFELLTDAEKRARATDMQKRQQSRSERFTGARRQAIDLRSLQLVQEASLEGTEGYPLLISPATTGVDLAEWAGAHRPLIEQRLLRHGAILFRGFGIGDVPQFECFARAVCPDLVGDYGDLPKEAAGQKVYKSTPYPADKAILFHNESSHTHRWPMKQFFSCIQVAQQGGETPIVDCRELYRKLDPALAKEFTERGLLYLRNFIEGLDVSWQDFFKTDQRSVVEARLRQLGTEFAWTGENNLRVRQRACATARHPKTGEWVFFNQIQLHHIECIAVPERDSLLELFSEADLPRNVYYGDGATIEPAVIAEISRLYAETAVSFPWHYGDVLMVDNMLSAHGRYPFKGPRRVIVAMGEMVNAADLVAVAA